MVLRDPKGGVGNVSWMRDAGFHIILCNIGDFPPSEWATIRARAKEAKIICGPWLRTSDDNKTFSVDRLNHLINVADDWAAPFMVNSESELKGSDATLTKLIASKIGERDAAVSMEAWPFSNVDWTPLRDYPMCPQIFPVESEPAKHPNACRAEWYRRGVKCVVFTFGSYRGQKPNDYDRLTPYGVYTADDCAQDYSIWGPVGTHDPCVPKPVPPAQVVDMEQIGTQHGITGFIDWLQQQPTVPTEHQPNYDSTKPGTWPWPERLERTLNILVKDHDQQVK
jgi:hypothetical protein